MLAWTWRVLGWVVTLAAVAAIALAVVVPRLGGATPYTVLTGSMRPGMPPGTLVVVRPIEPDQIATGMVVTYQLRSGDPTVVTHRVLSQGLNGLLRRLDEQFRAIRALLDQAAEKMATVVTELLE